jgi:hypothetical protein
MDFTSQNNIEIAPEVVSRSSNDGTVIVMKMTDDDFFYKITGVAAEMWLMFSNKKPNVGEVVGELAALYEVPAEKIQSDAQAFLNKALELNLIKLM